MELAVNVLATVMVGISVLISWAVVHQIRGDSANFRRKLLESADGRDKIAQQTKEKRREVDQLVRERIPEVAQALAEASTAESDHRREIAQAKDSVEQAAVAWDTRREILEKEGILNGDLIVGTEKLKLNQVESLIKDGYRLPEAGEFPLSPDHAQKRPPNPVREIQARRSQQDEEQRHTEQRLAEQMTNQVNNTDVPRPSRDSLEELRPLRERWGDTLKKIGRRGNRNEVGSDRSRQRPSRTRRTRKGS